MFDNNECDDDEGDMNWDDLKTINTFDTGFDSDSQKVKSENFNSRESEQTSNDNLYDLNSRCKTNRLLLQNEIRNIFTAKATTPVSLLVESLVQQLCTMLEPDQRRSSELYNTICEQLYQMNLIDETYSMGEFETMRSQYQRALYQLVSVAKGQELPSAFENVWPLTRGLDWSRYHREYEEVDFIAGGGFGKVFKARHKLDGVEYAIKKIKIKSATINNVLHHLSEVKTLASLNHVNIVPYKAAWLEPLIAEPENVTTNNDTDSSEDEEEPILPQKRTYLYEESSSDFIVFENSTEATGDEAPSSRNNSRDTTSQTDRSHKVIAKFHNKNISISERQPHLKLKWATLYIQMSLCQLTLREWLDTRNQNSDINEYYTNFTEDSQNIYYNVNALCKLQQSTMLNNKEDFTESASKAEVSEESAKDIHPKHGNIVSEIFSQLLSGVNYIHARGIVHHDIKPSNIFVAVEKGGKILIQLGDFGLACPLQNTPHSTMGLGTPLYAAPEQLNGQCDPKSDVYSLGIVLIELLMPFTTDMERVTTLKNARSGSVPTFSTPCYGNLVKRLLQQSDKRPDAFQLHALMNRLQTNKTNDITALQRKLSEQEDEIKLLKNQLSEESFEIKKEPSELELQIQKNLEMLKSKDDEIQELKMKIEEMEDKNNELRSKEDEISRLKDMLKKHKLSV